MTAPGHRVRPASLTVAAVVVGLEALAMIGFGIVEAGAVRAEQAAIGIGVAVIMLTFGLLLLLVTRGLWRMRRWSRSPAVLAQVLLVLTAWSYRNQPVGAIAALVGIAAVVAGVGLLHPRSTAVLTESRRADEAPPPADSAAG